MRWYPHKHQRDPGERSLGVQAEVAQAPVVVLCESRYAHKQVTDVTDVGLLALGTVQSRRCRALLMDCGAQVRNKFSFFRAASTRAAAESAEQ